MSFCYLFMIIFSSFYDSFEQDWACEDELIAFLFIYFYLFLFLVLYHLQLLILTVNKKCLQFKEKLF